MAIHTEQRSFDVVVIGGGLSGVCAAIAAAREGVSVALINNRSVFGGTGSSEVRMHVVGANCHSSKANLRETGILEEILLENKARNPYAAFPIFDMIIWEKVYLEKNITAFLNSNVEEVVMDGGGIAAVCAHQNTTETVFTIYGKIFVDATGHGTVGVLAGAANRTGSEGRCEFNEPTAPEEPNNDTMGNTLMFHAVNRGEPVKFVKPSWANTYSEEDLIERPHVDAVRAQKDGGGIVQTEEASSGALPEFSNVDAGYWWIELGGDYNDIIRQGEEIRDELLKCVYGVWDHLKNCGDHGVENYDLDWVGMVPGYRESRRLEGDYILNENDIRANRIFPDAVAYGGWPMDNHIPEGIRNLALYPSRVYNFPGCYTIPYRCYCSRNVDNLMMAGRDISASKMAFSSTRVMGTCSVGGQAVGTGAAMAVKYGCTPRQIGEGHISELQQRLLKNDCYLPGFANEDALDAARSAHICATGETEDGKAIHVINGISRSDANGTNYWQSAPLSGGPQTLTLSWEKDVKVSQIRLTFDTDLSHEIQPTMVENVLKRQVKGLPHELVKAYSVTALRSGKPVWEHRVSDNGQRLNVLQLPEAVQCDALSITVTETHGLDAARIFEIRVYVGE